MPYTYTNYLAAAYGTGTYNTSAYQATGSTTSTGQLTNTGFDILVAATVACVIVFSALVIRFWKRGRATKPTVN